MIDLEPLFERCQGEEIGLAVKTNNVKGMQVQCCNFAREHPEHKNIMACIPSLEGLIFLVKKSVELPG